MCLLREEVRSLGCGLAKPRVPTGCAPTSSQSKSATDWAVVEPLLQLQGDYGDAPSVSVASEGEADHPQERLERR